VELKGIARPTKYCALTSYIAELDKQYKIGEVLYKEFAYCTVIVAIIHALHDNCEELLGGGDIFEDELKRSQTRKLAIMTNFSEDPPPVY